MVTIYQLKRVGCKLTEEQGKLIPSISPGRNEDENVFDYNTFAVTDLRST